MSAGFDGHIDDVSARFKMLDKYNEKLIEEMSKLVNKTAKKLKVDLSRDKWFYADEALAYGIIDEIIEKRA
jgi:ATP-dependent Clp protease protease subunit